MSLFRGGFRTISGSIGDADQDDYRIDTPFASIGIRGTVHEGLIVGDALYTAVYEGGATISNNQGSIDTGIGASYDFAIVRRGEPPQGLLLAPPFFLNQNNQLEQAAADADSEDGNAAVPQQVLAAVRNTQGDNPGTAIPGNASDVRQDIDVRTEAEIRNNVPGTAGSLAADTSASQNINPLLFVRSPNQLTNASDGDTNPEPLSVNPTPPPPLEDPTPTLPPEDPTQTPPPDSGGLPILAPDFMSVQGLSDWAMRPMTEIANPIGTVTYTSNGFVAVDRTGAALSSLDMSFTVDLAGGVGAIRDGVLNIIDSRDNPWNVNFTGNLMGSSASFTNVEGQFFQGIGNPVSGSIIGIFVGDPQDPDFASAFSLQSIGNNVVNGQVLLGK
jgi:hypothetical protein